MEREPDPVGQCPSCGGPLEWAAVRYLPAERHAAGMTTPRWEGSHPRCAVSARRPGPSCPPLADPASLAAGPPTDDTRQVIAVSVSLVTSA